MRDLQSAKHRHGSTQKPLGRFILFPDAMLSTAQEILRTRNGRPMESARLFLNTVNEEALLQLVPKHEFTNEFEHLILYKSF